VPRTSITVTDVTRAGVTQPSQQNGDAANGMQIDTNDGKIILELSSNTGTTTFTFPIPTTVDGQSVASKTVAVGAAAFKVAGPYPPGIYNQPGSAMLFVDMDNTTNGRIRAYHLP